MVAKFDQSQYYVQQSGQKPNSQVITSY